jgi:hypothetical protein
MIPSERDPFAYRHKTLDKTISWTSVAGQLLYQVASSLKIKDCKKILSQLKPQIIQMMQIISEQVQQNGEVDIDESNFTPKDKIQVKNLITIGNLIYGRNIVSVSSVCIYSKMESS